MAVSSSMSVCGSKNFGINLTRTTIRTPMTEGKMRAVAGESLSAHKPARHAHWRAVNLATAPLPRMT